jgi:hypothetical protein
MPVDVKTILMYKLLCLVCCAWLLACTNESAPERKDSTTNANASPAAGTSLSTDSEMEILAECVDNAKDNAGNDLDDARAFAVCRCVLSQMQERYPQADSSAIVAYLTDTTQVAEMARKCQ